MSNHLRDRRHTIIYRTFWSIVSTGAFVFFGAMYLQALASLS